MRSIRRMVPSVVLLAACNSPAMHDLDAAHADVRNGDAVAMHDASPIDVAMDVADVIDVTDSATDAAPDVLMLPGGSAHLTFDDEFDTGAIDPLRWNRWFTSPAVINSELEFYAPDSFAFAPGIVRLEGQHRAAYGFDYTSGSMTTFGSFRQAYGYFEMRARLPAGNGLWPAFWLLSADQSWPPEIDVLENLGQDPTTAYLTYHWRDASGMHQSDGVPFHGPDFSAGYHTFAVDWRPGVVVWFIDGAEHHRVTGSQVTSLPMYMLLNLAIGGSWPVPPDSTTPFPAYYDVDYVRAYQYDGIAAGTSIPVEYGIATADVDSPSAGSTVNFDVRVRVNEAQPSGLIVQSILYDNGLHNMIAQDVFNTPAPLGTGELQHRWTETLPASLSPGVYRLSVGLFHSDWSPIRWLSNGVVITVR